MPFIHGIVLMPLVPSLMLLMTHQMSFSTALVLDRYITLTYSFMPSSHNEYTCYLYLETLLLGSAGRS